MCLMCILLWLYYELLLCVHKWGFYFCFLFWILVNHVLVFLT